MKNHHRRHPRRRASALAFALVTTIFLGVAAAAVLTLAGQEHRLTMRGIIVREANNAVESTINNGIAQIAQRVGNSGQYVAGILNATPLNAPTAATFGYGHDKEDASIPADAYKGNHGLSPIDDPATRITLRGGTAFTPSKAYTIPNGNPTTATDSFKGQVVTSKTFPLIASVRSEAAGQPPVQVFAKADLVIRDSNLFSYAIFYNTVPLEMAPGGTMIVNGSIRANSSVDKFGNIVPGSGDFYMGGSGGNVSVLGTIASSGNIIYGRHPSSGQTTTAVASAGVWSVPFRDANNNGTFDNVTGITYNGTDPDKNGDPFSYSGSNPELVAMKITDAAGKVVFLDSTHKDAAGNNDWKTLGQTLTNGSVQDSANGIKPVTLTGFKNPDDGALINQPPLGKGATGYDADKEAVKYANKAGLYLVVEPDGSVTGFEKPSDATAYKAIIAATPVATRTARDDWKAANAGKVLDIKSTGAVKTDSAFLDRRENKNVAAVDIDLGTLRSYVNGTAGKALAFTDADTHTYPLDTPSTSGWNGVMYVDVEAPDAGWTAAGKNTTMTAVKVINASQVPNRAEANAAGSPGFTLATNAPLYTVGHVNADGNTATGSNSMPDSGNVTKLGKETPVSFAADAITTLSSNWSDSASFTTTKPAPVTTEISAALLVGIVKSAGNNYSGGVENFPRLLEGWSSGTTLRIRGSMVAMFESRVATGKWNGGYYTVPTRDWGFSSIFASGAYPPGSPNIRSYRRINYRVINAAEYDSELKSSWVNDDGSTTVKYP